MNRAASRPRAPSRGTPRVPRIALLVVAAVAQLGAASCWDVEAERRDEARYSREVAVSLRAMAPGREACYQRSPTARAHRSSTVVSTWFVDDHGHAVGITVAPAPPDDELARCYRELIARQRFPVGEAGWRSRMEQRHDP